MGKYKRYINKIVWLSKIAICARLLNFLHKCSPKVLILVYVSALTPSKNTPSVARRPDLGGRPQIRLQVPQRSLN